MSLSALTTARGADVFLSEARLEVLASRVATRTEPTYSAWLGLQARAEAALTAEPHAPETWYVPGFYVDAEGHTAAKGGLADDANTAYELALCYRITGDVRYAHAAVRLIAAWPARVVTMRREDDSTLSFSYHFPAMIFAAALLADAEVWPTDAQQAFTSFVRTQALPMSTIDGRNNWGNWGLVLTLAAAAYLEDAHSSPPASRAGRNSSTRRSLRTGPCRMKSAARADSAASGTPTSR